MTKIGGKVVFSLIMLICCGQVRAPAADLAAADVQWVAGRVFENECYDEKKCLIEWNDGEDFLSLGLGHFIWYPQGAPGIFEESFRAFLDYARKSGADLPAWLARDPFPPCPWATKAQFLAEQKGPLYQDLFAFLQMTRPLQAAYLVERAQESLKEAVDAAPEDQRLKISRILQQMSAHPQGLYALIDYVNFKGTGARIRERYQDQGWGLLQVVLMMPETESSQETLREFSNAAKEVLKRRVSLSPPARKEERWLPGWLRRADSYLPVSK